MPPMQRSRNEANSLEGRSAFFFERRGYEGGFVEVGFVGVFVVKVEHLLS